MATKNCPHCNRQVPVACKKCGCGHIFFSTRRSSSLLSLVNNSNIGGANGDDGDKKEDDDLRNGQTRRRTGRVQREKPNFYDALQYDNQMRKQMQLRKKLKQSKSESDTPSNLDEGSTSSQREREGKMMESGLNIDIESVAPKRRRGRPPGLRTKKPLTTTSGRIQIQTSRTNRYGVVKQHNSLRPPSSLNGDSNKIKTEGSSDSYCANPGSSNGNFEDIEDIMKDVTPEKALQYNIVLKEINRKWVNANWKAS